MLILLKIFGNKSNLKPGEIIFHTSLEKAEAGLEVFPNSMEPGDWKCGRQRSKVVAMWLDLELAQSGPFQAGHLASRKGNEKAVPGKGAITFVVSWELIFMELLGDTCKHQSA